MTTPPDAVAAMFDLPPFEAPSDESAREAAEAAAAAEAELAAEIACALESGDVAGDAPDSRTDLRVKVSWPARMRLPDGHVVELQVRDISEAGVGLMSDEHIPARTVVGFEMDVPAQDEGAKSASIKGTIKTTYTVAHDSAIRCGATWVQVPAASLALVHLWIRRLAR
jgi:hypothetical protein